MPEDPYSLLDRSFAAVDALIAGIGPDQWSAPTPCSDWSVNRLVGHVVGMNRIFVAMLAGEPPPGRADIEPEQLLQAYRESAARLRAIFSEPGVLDRTFESPMGRATGAERLMIRLYDLLAHGWDLSRATAQPANLPEDAAEAALAFARGQVVDETRPGRFEPAQEVPADAPAIDRLVAFLGRSVA
ncbi:MAG TPA: TIGR03086 family metal-binding protein [Mycobacteriales bacterium]|nr:TIGR03086 family metal-binding protein [Mycobacteriales bacterium]